MFPNRSATAGVTIYLPALLAQGVGHAVQLRAESLSAALNQLAGDHPSIGDQLFDANRHVHAHLRLFVNDEDARNLGGLDTRLTDGDEVTIVAAVAGG